MTLPRATSLGSAMPRVMAHLYAFMRRARCAFGCRRCIMVSDEHGICGVCVACGKSHGYVSREQLAAYIHGHHGEWTSWVDKVKP